MCVQIQGKTNYHLISRRKASETRYILILIMFELLSFLFYTPFYILEYP